MCSLDHCHLVDLLTEKNLHIFGLFFIFNPSRGLMVYPSQHDSLNLLVLIKTIVQQLHCTSSIAWYVHCIIMVVTTLTKILGKNTRIYSQNENVFCQIGPIIGPFWQQYSHSEKNLQKITYFSPTLLMVFVSECTLCIEILVKNF